jgi:vacuolar-type H+-ATPase subunit I/STV1
MQLIFWIILVIGIGAALTRAGYQWGAAVERQTQLIARVDDMANELHELSERLSVSEKRNSPLERNDIETLENAQAVLVDHIYRATIFYEHLDNFYQEYSERLKKLREIVNDGKRRRY